jgi:hypothetical protein
VQVLDEIRAFCQRRQVAASWPHGASEARIAGAETRAGRPFPDEFSRLLQLHDGCSFGGVRFLGSGDFIDETELLVRAREFIQDTLRFDREEIRDSLPLANLGQPNDWLMYDSQGQFVVWLTADDHPSSSLEEVLRQQLRVLGDVY